MSILPFIRVKLELHFYNSCESDDFEVDGFAESGKAEKGKPIQAIDPNSLNRLEKVFGNINQWIKDHASKYKKRGKMIDITKRSVISELHGPLKPWPSEAGKADGG